MKIYKSKKYYKAINWIAVNDGCLEFDTKVIANSSSVKLISEAFRIHEEIIADDVYQIRMADYRLANFVID